MWRKYARISCPGECLFTRVGCHSAIRQWGTLWVMAKALAACVLINSDNLCCWTLGCPGLTAEIVLGHPQPLLCYYSNWVFGLWRATSQAVMALLLRKDLQNENRHKTQNDISLFWDHLGFSIFWFSAHCCLFLRTFKLWLILLRLCSQTGKQDSGMDCGCAQQNNIFVL